MQNFTSLIRTAVLASFVVLVGWWTMFLRNQIQSHEIEVADRDAQIADLTGDIAEKDELLEGQALTIQKLEEDLAASLARVQELELSIWLLKVDHRLARIEVLAQGPSGEGGKLVTRVRFQEIDENGEPAGPARELEIEGKILYVEGLVIKFSDEYVEGGDALRGTSVAIFKRLFSENQAPSEGVPIDRPRTHPLPHRGDNLPDPFYEELWERFWDYANDPELAASKGVRAIHGEAPSIELRPGMTYRVELRSSGGLTIRAE